MSIISISNLSKKYTLGNTHSTSIRDLVNNALGIGKDRKKETIDKEFWALKDINLDIKQGEVVGIIGKNGAGKSTLLKILSRITAPTTGKITIKGRIASLLEVGTGFHPELTGRENIFLNGSILGMTKSEIKSKFDEIVAFSEIEKFIDTPVKRYSSGMYVRLAFAVAAHLDPEILIVDEVLAVGDYSFQHKCFERIESIRDDGKTILFVSHNIQAISRLCNRGVIFSQGQVVLDDNIKEATATYLQNDNPNKNLASISLDTPNDLHAWINDVTLYGERDCESCQLEVGEKWSVLINISVKNKIPDFIVGIGLTTIDSTAVRTCWSELSDLESGNYCFTFKEDTLILTPGEYYLSIGISSRMKNIQYFEDLLLLAVQPTGKVAKNSNIPSLTKGIILNQMSVSVTHEK